MVELGVGFSLNVLPLGSVNDMPNSCAVERLQGVFGVVIFIK